MANINILGLSAATTFGNGNTIFVAQGDQYIKRGTLSQLATWINTLSPTFAGDVSVAKANPTLKVNAATGTDAVISLQVNDLNKWSLYLDHSNDAFYLANGAFSAGVQLASQAATSWSAFSDRRLKDNVETLDVLAILRTGQFRAVSYVNRLTGETEIGGIAQEQLQLFPSLVRPGADDSDAGEPIQSYKDTRLWSMVYDRYGIAAMQGVNQIISIMDRHGADIAAIKQHLNLD